MRLRREVRRDAPSSYVPVRVSTRERMNTWRVQRRVNVEEHVTSDRRERPGSDVVVDGGVLGAEA